MVTRESVVDVKKLFIIFLFYILFSIIPCLGILCGNDGCTEKILVVRTVNSYASRGDGTLSFKVNTNIDVYGKAAGKNKDLYLVKIDGKLGYAPANLVQEVKVVKRNLIEVPFKLPTETTQTGELQKKDSIPPDLPQRPTIDSKSVSSNNSPSNSQQSSGVKAEVHSSSLSSELETSTEDHNDNLIKDTSVENENFTVDDLNQYSMGHVHMTSESHEGRKVEQQTSEELSSQNENIQVDHQEVNLPSPTEAEKAEMHPSSMSPPPNFQSNDEHKNEHVDDRGDHVSIEPSLSHSSQSVDGQCKSSVVFEGTTLCEEYYESTAPSESSFVNQASTQSVFVHTSTQLYPSTESTTSVDIPVNNPELPSTGAQVVSSDAPSFVSSVDSQSLSDLSLENTERSIKTIQPSEPTDTLASQNSVQHSKSEVATAVKESDTTAVDKTEGSIEIPIPMPTDEPSTLSKLTNYVKNVFTSIGNEQIDNQNANVEQDIEEEGDEEEEEDDDADADADEEEEEDQTENGVKDDGNEIDETDGTELPIYFSDKDTKADHSVVSDNVHANIAEKNVTDGENNIAEESSTLSFTQSPVQNADDDFVSNSVDATSKPSLSENNDKTTSKPHESSTFEKESDAVKTGDLLTTDKQITEPSSGNEQNTITAEIKESKDIVSDTAESKPMAMNKNMPTEEKAGTKSSSNMIESDESHSNKQNTITSEVKESRQNVGSIDNTENVETEDNKSSNSAVESNQFHSNLKKTHQEEKRSLPDHNEEKSMNEDSSRKVTSESDVTDSKEKTVELNDSQLDEKQVEGTKSHVEDNSVLVDQNVNQTLPNNNLDDSISESSLDSHAKTETVVLSSQTDSIHAADDMKDSSVSMHQDDSTTLQSNDTTSLDKEDSSKMSGQSNVDLEESSAIKVEASHSVNSNPFSSKDNTSEADASITDEEQKAETDISEDTLSNKESLLDVTVHEDSQNENGFKEITEDSLQKPKISVHQDHSDLLPPNSQPVTSKFDVYDKPTNSEIHADNSESGVDVDSNTKPTLVEEDNLKSLPLSEKEINDAITVTSTESTRSILSYNEDGSEFEYKENHSKDETSDDIVGIFREYIGLLPAYLQIIIELLPLQVQDQLSEWEKNGLSPRVTVVTWITAAFTSVVCICTVLIQRRSKEQMLIGKLGTIEQKIFTVSTERDVLKDELNNVKHQAALIQKNLLDQQNLAIPLQQELEEVKNENRELLNNVEAATCQVEMLQSKLVSLQKLAHTTDEMNKDFMEKLTENEKILSEMEQNLQKAYAELSEKEEKNEELKLSKEQLVSQVYQLDSTCSQLLQEAEVWNQRVSELTSLLEREKQECEDMRKAVKLKETETKGLENTLLKMKLIEENVDLSDEERNENVKNLMDASLQREQLREIQEEKATLQEELKVVNGTMQEKEGQLLAARDEVEKLKFSYNQALQDKMEAQTKLEVLTNYFKEKEVQLQRELGVQEAMRQQKEEDASSATNRVALIEQENISYKHQLATLKQELEETERGYKNQVAMHEKKAHENWLAARSSERKLEEAKQEASLLRQRLTLLEREQENWVKAEVDGVVRPVPKRYLSPNGEVPYASNKSTPQQNSVEIPDTSSPALSRGIPEPGKIPNPPLLPMDRPLPPPAFHPMDPRFPLPPPPFMPPPPFGERLPPPAFMDPWRFPPPPLPPMHRRMSPQDYDRGRLPTPPNCVTPPYERDIDRHSVNSRDMFDRRPPLDRYSPLREPSSRDSRNSSPPHVLPHFHDNPPPRPYGFPPPPPPQMLPPRFTPPPPPLSRREPYFPPNMPLDQRAVERSKDPANSPRHSHERTPPSEVKSTATAV